MKTAIENFIKWLLISSADPAGVSLTFKGIGIGLVGLMPSVLLSHFNLGTDQLNLVVTGSATVVQDALVLIGAIATVTGTVRKIWLTVFPPNRLAA